MHHGSDSEVQLVLLGCGLMEDTGSSGCADAGLRLMSGVWREADNIVKKSEEATLMKENSKIDGQIYRWIVLVGWLPGWCR